MASKKDTGQAQWLPMGWMTCVCDQPSCWSDLGYFGMTLSILLFWSKDERTAKDPTPKAHRFWSFGMFFGLSSPVLYVLMISKYMTYGNHGTTTELVRVTRYIRVSGILQWPWFHAEKLLLAIRKGINGLPNWNLHSLFFKFLSHSGCCFTRVFGADCLSAFHQGFAVQEDTSCDLEVAPRRYAQHLPLWDESLCPTRIPVHAGIECKFIEQWHQKLHTNSAPDDIAICEGYLGMIRLIVCWDIKWRGSEWTYKLEDPEWDMDWPKLVRFFLTTDLSTGSAINLNP